jgi:hypothetical protein
MARRRDDDYEDDYDDRGRGREEKKSGGMPKWPFFVFGGSLLVLLLCGGGIAGIFFGVRSLVKRGVQTIEESMPAPDGTREVDDAKITQALVDLKGPNKSWTLSHIRGWKPVEGRRKEMCNALEALLTSNEFGVPSAAAGALSVWGTEDSAPALHKALQSQDMGLRAEAIKALGQIKSASSAGPLSARLSDIFDRQAASEALKKIGPKAENEVVKYLANTQNDVFARQEACNILAEIGTKNGSIPALQKVVKENNQFLTNSANAAITSINNRGR